MKVLAVVALLVACAFAAENPQKRQVLVGAYPSYGYGLSTGYGLSSYGYGYPSVYGSVGYPAYGAYGTHFIGKRAADEPSDARKKRQVLVGAYPSYGYGLSTGYGLSSYGYGYPSVYGSVGYPYGGVVYGK